MIRATLAAGAAAFLLAGCATAPAPSNFERCMTAVAGGNAYAGQRVDAADWCATHGAAP